LHLSAYLQQIPLRCFPLAGRRLSKARLEAQKCQSSFFIFARLEETKRDASPLGQSKICAPALAPLGNLNIWSSLQYGVLMRGPRLSRSRLGTIHRLGSTSLPNSFNQDSRRFIVRILGHKFTTEYFGEDGLFEAVYVLLRLRRLRNYFARTLVTPDSRRQVGERRRPKSDSGSTDRSHRSGSRHSGISEACRDYAVNAPEFQLRSRRSRTE
jgi:hypothetical protein